MDHDPLVTGLLRQQFGLITKDQLFDAGVSARTVSRMSGRGEYEALVPGVLRSAAFPVTFETRAMAVQLHAGQAGALSGPTAARVYGCREMPGELVWCRASDRRRTSLPGWVRRTESPWLFAGADFVRQHGCWRLLAPAPMLLTLAELFNDHRFERAAEDAWHLKLVTPDDAAAFLDSNRCRGRPGVGRFERWLDRTAARSRPSQSGFELDVLDAVRAVGLPEPRRQYPLTLASGELIHLDFAWPEATLAVEPGHSWWHGGDLKTRADNARDRACGRVGWHVMRFDQSHRADLAGLGREVLDTYRTRVRGGR